MRRAHSCPMIEAPRYGRGSSATVAAARSTTSLMATLIGSIERLARLRLITTRSGLNPNLVVELIGRHQLAAGCGGGLARNHAGARLPSDALVAEVARDHGFADQRHRVQQEFDDVLARPLRERLRPIEAGTGIRQFTQDRRDCAGVPWLRIERGQADD